MNGRANNQSRYSVTRTLAQGLIHNNKGRTPFIKRLQIYHPLPRAERREKVQPPPPHSWLHSQKTSSIHKIAHIHKKKNKKPNPQKKKHHHHQSSQRSQCLLQPVAARLYSFPSQFFAILSLPCILATLAPIPSRDPALSQQTRVKVATVFSAYPAILSILET